MPSVAQQSPEERQEFDQLRAALADTMSTHASSSTSLPHLKLDDLERHLASARELEQAQDKARYVRSRRVVFGPGKHYSARKLDELQMVDLSPKGGLSVDAIGVGKVLVARIVSNTYKAAAVQFIVQDPAGTPALVHVYHLPSTYSLDDLDGLFPRDGLLAIKEPNLRFSSTTSYPIRVDSPSDLVTLQPSSPLLQNLSWSPSLPTKSSPSTLKTTGNLLFAKKDFRKALNSYLLGLDLALATGDIDLVLVFHSNIAASYLALSPPKPGSALRHCDRALAHFPRPAIPPTTSLSPIHKKLLFRAAQASYALSRYASCATFLSPLLSTEAPDDAVHDLHRKYAARKLEQEEGEFDWKHLFDAALHSPHLSLDHAPYTSSLVAVAASPNTGGSRGLFAVSDISRGTLLLVAKPLAAARPNPRSLAKVVAANLFSESRDPCGMVDLVAQLVEKLADCDEAREAMRELWAGEELGRSPVTAEAETGVDVSRLEAQATYNAFHPDSVANQTFSRPNPNGAENDTSELDDSVDSPSAIYAIPSALNHSCVGNVTYSFLSTTFILRARRDISAGEELRDSYVDSVAELETRREALAKHGFVCYCELCQWDEADGEANRRKRKRLIEQDFDGEGEAELRLRVEAIRESYLDPGRRVKPALYRPLRAISRLLAAMGDWRGSIEAEMQGLASLGRGEGESVVSVGDTNAVLSALFIARSYQALKQVDKSKIWLAKAQDFEKGQCGAELFSARYQGFAELNGLDLEPDKLLEL